MGEHIGLNLIDGTVEKINKTSKNKDIKVPHISWNEIIFEKNTNYEIKFADDLNGRSFYFVHSYMAIPKKNINLVAKCKYFDVEVPAIVQKEKVVGFQFHPEKSGKNGLKLLKQTIESLLN